MDIQGIVLFAHGSRDPAWRRPMEAVAARVAATAPHVLVACAYLEITEPDLSTAADALVARGATAVRIVPLFLGVGKHVRNDLPGLVDALRMRYPAVAWTLQPAVGEDERVINLLADMAISPNQ